MTWSKIVYWDKFLVAFLTYRRATGGVPPKKLVIKDSENSLENTGVSLFWWSCSPQKTLRRRCFSANFAKSLRKLFLQNTSSRVLFQRKLTPWSSQFAKVSDCINYCGFLMFYFIKNGFLMFYFIKNGFLMFYFIKNLQPPKSLCISNIKQPYVRSLPLIRLFFFKY